MARFLSFRQLVVTAALLLGSLSSFAYDFEVDGFYYNKLTDNTAEVTYKYLDESESLILTGYEDMATITIPSTVDYDGVSYSVTAIRKYTFWGCSDLTSAVIPDGVTSIGDEAFELCSNLTSVTIGKGVTSIGKFAFDFCSGLTSVTLPAGVTSIGIGAFAACDNLKSINIPDAVTSIGDNAFSGCLNLTSITVGENNANFKGDNGVLYNKDMTKLVAYPSASGSFTIPNSVTSIGICAFSVCRNLTAVNIPDGVTSIGDFAFEGCSGLASVNIPDGVTSIGRYVFAMCESLTSVVIPDGVTSIGESAFGTCSSLTSINIPAGVTSIGNSAFINCSGLTSIVCLADTPPTCEEDVFDGVSMTECALYVPEASLSLYQSTAPWSEFANIQSTTGIDNVKVDEGKAAVIYDLNGRRLGEPRHGLNIINGKKVLVK